MSAFKKAKKPALWVFKIGIAVTIFKMVISFLNQDGSGAAEALLGSGGATILIAILVYVLALPFYAIKAK